jgi:hypothetical protein
MSLRTNNTSRRAFLSATAVTAGSAWLPQASWAMADKWGSESFVPLRPITQGPQAHWFGYYDKLQFDPENRLVLGMAVDFEDRPPTPEDRIRLGMVDLADRNRWIEFGQTNAWCWQQGCMLQWLPGADSQVIYNTRQGDHYGSIIQDVKTGEQRVLEAPIYTVSADGKTAMSVNFARLGVLRPGYGYEGIPDPYQGQPMTNEDGIRRVDLETGKVELVISLAQMLQVEPQSSMANSLNWFNHLLFNPRGDRFIFLHRWRPDTKTRWETRMLTAKSMVPTCMWWQRLRWYLILYGKITRRYWLGHVNQGRAIDFFSTPTKVRYERLLGKGCCKSMGIAPIPRMVNGFAQTLIPGKTISTTSTFTVHPMEAILNSVDFINLEKYAANPTVVISIQVGVEMGKRSVSIRC